MTGGAVPRAAAGRRIALVAGAALYGLALAAILFWPQHVDGPGGERARWLIDPIAALGVPEPVAYAIVEIAANVTLFVPGGALLALAAGLRLRWWIPVAGLVGSAAIETAQALFLPGRTADPGDVVADTAGVVLGALAVVLTVRISRSRISRLRRGRPSRAG